MAIQWFPGHMNKAKKNITDRLKDIHVVIELLDARLPASSANPLLARLAKGKPTLKVLNKQDLADPETTQMWLDWYCRKPNTQAIGLDASDRAPTQKLIAACRQLAPNRGGLDKPLKVLICGIPNVGKSTLINTMTGRKIAKTGNMPGVTKSEQRIYLADDFILYDTPGMLWPKIEVEEGGYNLAASGAVGRNAMDEEEVSLELLKYLMKHYPSQLEARYKLDSVVALQDWEVLELIAKKRGAVLGGGRINYQKAAELVLTEYRDGMIGRLTLERPNEWEKWLRHAKEVAAQKAKEREERMKAQENKSS